MSEMEGRGRYEGVSVEEKRDSIGGGGGGREEELYSVLSQNYVIAPPPALFTHNIESNDITPPTSSSSSSFTTSHHHRAASAAASFRPSNPTPSSTSLPLSAWSASSTSRLPGRQLSQTLPRPLPTAQAAPTSLPQPTALTPSANSSSSNGSSNNASPVGFPVSSTADVSPSFAAYPPRHRSHVSLPGSPNTQRLMEGFASPPVLSGGSGYDAFSEEGAMASGTRAVEGAEEGFALSAGIAYRPVSDESGEADAG